MDVTVEEQKNYRLQIYFFLRLCFSILFAIKIPTTNDIVAMPRPSNVLLITNVKAKAAYAINI